MTVCRQQLHLWSSVEVLREMLLTGKRLVGVLVHILLLIKEITTVEMYVPAAIHT